MMNDECKRGEEGAMNAVQDTHHSSFIIHHSLPTVAEDRAAFHAAAAARNGAAARKRVKGRTARPPVGSDDFYQQDLLAQYRAAWRHKDKLDRARAAAAAELKRIEQAAAADGFRISVTVAPGGKITVTRSAQ